MLFSIIIPSYNQGQYLEQNLLSLLNQEENIEIIVIDGGSTDKSVAIIKKFKNRIKYWQSQKDHGTYDAINMGLKHCLGDYIAIVNSDDFLLPKAITKIREFIQKNDYPAWVTGGIHIINEHGNIKGKIIPTRPQNVHGYSFIPRCWIYHPSTFIKKEAMSKVGAFAPVNVVDYDYWLRLERAGYSPIIINDYIAGLRFHTACKSYDYLKITMEIKSVLFNFLQKHQMIDPQTLKVLNEYDVQIFKYSILNRKLQRQQLLIPHDFYILIKNYPSVIKERWFWGAIKRVLLQQEIPEYNPFLYLES